MATKIKFARKIDFLVTETITNDKKYIKQTYRFWTSNKKYLKYAYDQRYCLMEKLETVYKKHALNLEFVRKEESEDNVVFVYKYDGDFISKPSSTINCEFYLPPFNGCKYCSRCVENGDFLYCQIKEKHYDFKGIKNCPVFKSKNEIIS